MSQQQKGFWFPTMKIAEITQALDDWGLRVSDDQIQKPTGEVVQSIYLVFLAQLTGITPEILQEPVNSALATVTESPEYYQNSLKLNLIYLHVSRIAQAACVKDFNMKDFVYPESERTRKILSAIINFIKFCEEREVFLRKLRDQSAAALQERDSLEEQVGEMRRKIQEIKLQREKDEPRCQELRKKNTDLTEELIAAKEAQAALLNEFNMLKKYKSELSAEKESLVKKVEVVSTAITAIRSRIVQSPDRIKKHISELSLTYREDRNNASSIERKSRELKAKLDALAVFEEDLKKLNDILRLADFERCQLVEKNNRLQTFKAELEQRQIYRTQLLGRDDRAKRQLKHAEEKLTRAQEYAEERKTRSEMEIERLKREYEAMSEERRENDKVVEETKMEADEVERKMLEHLKKSENEVNELLGEYWNLRHQTDVYMETLANKLGMDVGGAT